jgi:YbbR domain-containing protein
MNGKYFDITDFSDKNAWIISASTKSQNNDSIIELSIAIDRNTGILIASRYTERLQVYLSGDCQKVDMKTRNSNQYKIHH